jgi:hypothetical protein
VCVIAASAALGAVATIVTRAQPGLALGLFVLAGTVAAALTIEPRAGRLIFPVPALSYLIAALAAGAVYNHSGNKTELAVGAAQWIANGFFVMVLATLLAIALTTVRWLLWRRSGQVPLAADWPAETTAPRTPWPGGTAAASGWGDPRSPGPRPVPEPPRMPPVPGAGQGTGAGPGPGSWGPEQRPRPTFTPNPNLPPGPSRAPYQGPGGRPGSGPYNFSNGA